MIAQHVMLVALMLLSGVSVDAQDIHFSQFNQVPFNLNPALVGQFDGAYRFTAQQRTQWRSITTPYSTFGLSADARFPELPDGILNKKDDEAENLGFHTGIHFFHDKAGDSHLTTNMLDITIGDEFPLTKGTLAGAVSLGFTNLSIDYSALRYDAQWNGLQYDPERDPGEQFARDARTYLNAHAGIAYVNRISKRKEIVAGISAFNLSNPKQSFFNNNLVRLDSRWNLHGSYRFPIKTRFMAEPSAAILAQGTYREVNVGALGYYILSDKSWMWRSIYFGLYGRAGDAGYLIAGMQYDAWNVGISYDINTSNLKPASSGRGGFEFTAVYILPPSPKLKPVKVCPDWI